MAPESKRDLAALRLCDLGQVRPQSGKHASVPALRRQNALGPCRSPAARKKALSDGAKPLHDLVLQQPQRPARASLRRATMTRRIGDAAGAGSPKFGARNQKIVTSRLCNSRTSTSAVRQADRLRGAAHPVVNIRTSVHPLAPALECFGCSARGARSAQTHSRIALPCNRAARNRLA